MALTISNAKGQTVSSATADASGGYEAHALPAGTYTVTLSASNAYSSDTQTLTFTVSKGSQTISFPVAHGEGNYVADEATLDRLENENRVVFRYAEGDNPNGSARNIAGILNEKRNVLGLMPHPERVVDPLLGGEDGKALFQSLIESLS